MAQLRNSFPRFTKKCAQIRQHIVGKQYHHRIQKPLRKLVILIGCEYVTYDEIGILHRLPGCHTDVSNIRQMLISHYGYESGDFIILSDESREFEQPTRLNIEKIFEQVTQRKDLSQIVIYYSGHGTRTKDRFYKEKPMTTGKNTINIQKYLKTLYTFEDCVVPCDYLDAGLISGIYFRTHFWSKIPLWTKVTAIFDSCNSGSIFNLPFRYRGDDSLERDISFGFFQTKKAPFCGSSPAAPPTAESKPLSLIFRGRDSVKNKSDLPFIISISGCRNDQRSVAVTNLENKSFMDNTIENVRNNQWEGCMSFAFREVLKSHNFGSIGMNQLIDEMRLFMEHRKYSQIPQLSLSHDVKPSSILHIF